ncbi:MAG: putative toxin-antitoxin system toxin component, PIN family [Chitinophagaceae bacterium]|nr:putative toxin-antitoxin system toxin component, PIN family [Chitinophagaceae bacterium]
MKTILVMVMKIVIDTNVLVSSLSRHSVYHWLITNLLNGKFNLYITNEILLEYEEILKAKYSPSVAHNFLIALKELPNVYFTQVYYQWQLLKDEDDNKFSDCYVAANAEYLLTHDSGFKILKSIPFPPINVVSLDEFKELIRL